MNSVNIIHKINIIIGSMFFIKLTYYFIKTKKLYRILSWLEKYTFIVYAFHGIIVGILQKLFVRIMPMQGIYVFVEYFGVVLLGILLCITTGMLLKKISPKVYAIIKGGRI
jgi:fucose 4-O-acetylase-like acetyltransferase